MSWGWRPGLVCELALSAALAQPEQWNWMNYLQPRVKCQQETVASQQAGRGHRECGGAPSQKENLIKQVTLRSGFRTRLELCGRAETERCPVEGGRWANEADLWLGRRREVLEEKTCLLRACPPGPSGFRVSLPSVCGSSPYEPSKEPRGDLLLLLFVCLFCCLKK